MHPILDARPIIVALAGPNGAGKSTFFRVFLRDIGLRFVNADEIGRELGIDPYRAAAVAQTLRAELARQRESFVFETVLSDPVGDKVDFLTRAATQGYAVVMCFIGISSPDLSDERVAMRVSQGGHDVPAEKLRARYRRTLVNLERAAKDLPLVLVFDNSDLAAPFRKVAVFEGGRRVFAADPLPPWLPAFDLPRGASLE